MQAVVYSSIAIVGRVAAAAEHAVRLLPRLNKPGCRNFFAQLIK